MPLVQIFLQHNDLSGTVPAALGDVSTLASLFVDGNKLTGDIPADLCRRSPFLNEEFFQGDFANVERDGCTSISCPVDSVSREGVAPCFPCDNGQFRYLGMEHEKCKNITERDVLNTFFDETAGPHWYDSLGWGLDDVDYCDWVGVDCGPNGNVVNITLQNKNLQGRIPSELGLLTHLKVLDLSDNKLTGYLPSDLRFTLLEYLDISGNKLRGIVPPLLCTKDINCNGPNGDFDCDYIACPVGTYSTLGYMSQAQDANGDINYVSQCVVCNDESAKYLGMKTCSSPILIGSLDYKAAKNITAGIALLVSFFLLAVLCISERNRRRAKTLREVAAEETLTLEHTDFDYETEDALPLKDSPPKGESPENDHPQPIILSEAPRETPARGNNNNGRAGDSENELWLDVPNII